MAKRRRKRKSQFLDETSSGETEKDKKSFRLNEDLRDEIHAWAEEAAQAHNLMLVDVEAKVRGRWIFRVFVDKPGEVVPGDGINVDECADVSRYLEAYMDADERVPESYVLEVSSPGVERELKNPRHVAQATDKKVQVVVREQVDGKNKLIGKLLSFDEGVLTIDVEELDEPVEVDWDVVKKAQLKYDFDF